MNMNKLQRYTMDSKGLPMFDDEGEYVRFDDVAAELDNDNWISVAEKLPDNMKHVLTADTQGLILDNLIDQDGYWFLNNGYVTHWQPLPKAPKNE